MREKQPTEIDNKYIPVVQAALLNLAHAGALDSPYDRIVLDNERAITEDYRQFLLAEAAE